jgi:hypothetical protein
MAIDVAWIIFGFSCIQEGAREGVRYAVTGSGQAESSLNTSIQQVVQKYSFGFVAAGNVNVDYYPPTGYSASGTPATLDGTSAATDVGNIVKVTVQGVNLSGFGPIFNAVTAMRLSASASDVMQ